MDAIFELFTFMVSYVKNFKDGTTGSCHLA